MEHLNAVLSWIYIFTFENLAQNKCLNVGDSRLHRFVLWGLRGVSWTWILLRAVHLVFPWGWEGFEICRGRGESDL